MNGLERDPVQGGEGIKKPWYKSWWAITVGALLVLLLLPIALPALATAAIWLKTPWKTSRKILATGGVVLAMATLPLLGTPSGDKRPGPARPQGAESSSNAPGTASSDSKSAQERGGLQSKNSQESPGGAGQQPQAMSQGSSESQAQSEIAAIAATVTRVVDGDTIDVSFNGKSEKVRFIGVNTPETKDPRKPVEPYGKEAAAYTTQLAGKEVYLELDVQERDKYGRLLAYIWLERPSSRSEADVRTKMFNARLLLDGYAQVMTIPPNVRYADAFVQFQREARSANKGLWSLPPSGSSSLQGDGQSQSSASSPTQSSQGTESYYAASANSEVFHRPNCSYVNRIKRSNLIFFTTREEALNSNRRPCKVCNP